MGKKTKQGKARRDVFYRRAKEAGYRARAAYKLIQLNKKFDFLKSSRVCIDLCAAPGSWMQVASKFMPPSSVIIGVDQHPISHIPNTLSIQGDITTEKVRQDLRSNLKTWKADLVLHDGAPSVGQNWLHDAYQQNLLVLHAFKLACQFLQRGGIFITKIFRSKDHLSLQYIFKKLFKKVEATKPIASRFESAEAFVVCLGYLCPDKIDSKFFDPHYVFQTLEAEPKSKINATQPAKVKRKAEGYEEGITMLFKTKKISDFIRSASFMDILEEANKFEWDLQYAKDSPHTTSEIIEFCKDIKVLGRKDIKSLLSWRKLVKADLENLKRLSKRHPGELDSTNTTTKNDEEEKVDEEIEELTEIQQQIKQLEMEKEKEDKRHRKKIEKRKKKLEDKLKLRLMVPGDQGPHEASGEGLFSLNSLTKVKSVDHVIDKAAEIVAESDSESSDDETKSKKYEYFSRENGGILDSTGTVYRRPDDSDSEKEYSDSDSDIMEGLNLEKGKLKEAKQRKRVSFADDVAKGESDSEDDERLPEVNPFLTDLVGDNPRSRKERKAEKWFSNEMFEGLEHEELEDYEVDSILKDHELNGGQQESITKGETDQSEFRAADAPDSSETDDDSEEEDEDTVNKEEIKKTKGKVKLNSVGLALATKMIQSKKTMRDMYDDGWNRYMTGDEDLPDWFAQDELKHNNPGVQVDKEDLDMYDDRNKAVDSRSMKKVVEAKARKQRRAKKRLAKARKKATEITNNEDMTAKEKALELKKIYKKATTTKRKDKTYVVMKKSFGGRRPKSVKGPSKMVDRRLKKDKRVAHKIPNKGGKRKKSNNKR